jgi:hypothetical protein
MATADNRAMDRLINLDAVAAELARRRDGWVRDGLATGEFTWRDAAALWPQPITTDRTAIADPESLGLTFRAISGDQAQLVLWRGGWADLNALIGAEIVTETPEFADTAECLTVTESLARRLVRPRRGGYRRV